MTDNEIIKGINCCLIDQAHITCDSCPYEKDSVCTGDLGNDILSLINRQKEKIELLNLENLQMIASIKHLKAEAIKEFAERLKENACLGDYPWDEERVYLFQIDRLVKEMVGESNG